MCLWAANQRRYWRMRDVNIAQLFQKHDLPADVKDMIFSLSEFLTMEKPELSESLKLIAKSQAHLLFSI